DGWVTGQLRELGARYEIAYDDVPPTISGFGFWGADRLRIVASDTKSGLNSYYGYIDDEFVLFEPQEKSNALVCFLKDSPIKRTGRMRTFRFVAIDNRNNKKEFVTQFKY
ncbi:MAG: M23 family peptidase, partial [Prevotella sp.]|nr:M23 family peptidase [Prevotella sp.]